MEALRDWLIAQGLEGTTVGPLLGGAVERLVAAGVPLSRAYLALPTVDRLVRVKNHVWRRGDGLSEEAIGHEAHHRAFEHSPFAWMIERGLVHHHWRFAPGAPPTPFPVIETVRGEGATAYLTHLVGFGAGTTSALRGVALSFATDAAEGFGEAALRVIEAAVPALALAAYRIVLYEIAVGVLEAYVGRDAGRRVLAGEIRRGHGEALTAALMFADLSGFTAATEAAAGVRGGDLIARLGLHLAAMVEPVEARGGEVLKFVGDGLIAAFPLDPGGPPDTACAAALAAAREALAKNARVNEEAGGAPLGLDVVLHLGTVFYGNIGAGRRLDFTVIGPAVNELSRIEALCAELAEPLLLSADFARHCGAPVRGLGGHRLRGVAAERELFAPAA